MSHKPVNSISTPITHLVGPGSLKVINGRLAYTTGHGSPTRLDPAALENVSCFGPVGVTDQAVILLLKHNIHVAFLTSQGKSYRGCLHHLRNDTALLRIQQCMASAKPTFKYEMAQYWVAEKITSQITAARHYQRQGLNLGDTLSKLKVTLNKAKNAAHIDVLRGVEGEASAIWFRLLGQLLSTPWEFTKRIRRPPTDPVNAILSLGYTFLVSRTAALCEANGLEPALGTLHEYRAGRPSLACDIMEPLRIPAVDRWVIALCNQNHIVRDDFLKTDKGVRLKKEIFPQVLANWEDFWYKSGCFDQLLGFIQHFSKSVRAIG